MSKYFLGGCLLALLATSCNSSSSTSAEAPPTTSAAAPATAAPAGDMVAMNHADHLAARPGMGGPTTTSSGPRAQAMRLHDATMNQMDALTSERQRLTDHLAKLSPTTPATQRQIARLRRTVATLQQADTQMMDWMHHLQEPDSTSQPKAKVDAYWRQQLPYLRQLEQRTTAALDSAKAIR